MNLKMDTKFVNAYIEKLNEEKNILEGLLKNKIDTLYTTCEAMQNTTPWSSLDFNQIFKKPERITVAALVVGGLTVAALGCFVKKSILKGIGTGCVLMGAAFIAKEEGMLSFNKLNEAEVLALKNLTNCREYVSQEIVKIGDEANSQWKNIIGNIEENLILEIKNLPINNKLKEQLENMLIDYSMDDFSAENIIEILKQSIETGDDEMYKSMLSSCFTYYTSQLNKNYELLMQKLKNLSETIESK